MITKSIEKYKPTASTLSRVVNSWPYQRTNSVVMDKQQYANYVTNLGLQKGDLVVLKGCPTPFGLYNIWRIEDIEEIHHLVKDWGSHTTGPYILTFSDWRGTVRSYKGGAEMYERIEDIESLPKDWRNTLNADTANN